MVLIYSNLNHINVVLNVPLFKNRYIVVNIKNSHTNVAILFLDKLFNLRFTNLLFY